jgi:hypothetical protein
LSDQGYEFALGIGIAVDVPLGCLDRPVAGEQLNVEQVIIGLAKPAERRELPPLMDPPDQITIDKVFNYWCVEARDGWALSRLGIR